jgi:2-phospho-L-lactate guanylyltransferase
MTNEAPAPRDLWAVVPVKAFGAAKTRLAPERSPEFRAGLAQAMAEDVLAALSQASVLAGTIVVSDDAQARALGLRYGARVWTSGARAGHTGAVMAAARRLAEERREGMLTVPADVPCITADEVAQLVAAHGAAPAFTIAPAHDRRGSNAILMTPPLAVPLAFGDDSFVPHVEAARRRGIVPAIVPLPGIGLDIDNESDLARLIAAQPGGRTGDYLRRAVNTTRA